MAEIFLSYTSEDRERVIPLVEALESDGFSVWWDREIRPGPSFDREIEAAINEARCLVVVWSAHSVESEWVRSEVEEGVRKGILVPILIDDVLPPLAHRRRQSANLNGWAGERDGEYEKLLTGVRATLDDASQPETGEREAATATSVPRQPTAIPRARRRTSSTVSKRSALLLAATCLLVGGGIAAIATWFGLDPGSGAPRPIRQFTIELPDGLTIADAHNPLDISADGRHIVFSATGPSGNQLYIRPLSTRKTVAIEGVGSGIESVFVSPDGKWIGFYDFIERELKKVPVSGGRPVTLAGLENPYGMGFYGASWGRNGDIGFFSFDDFAVMRVPAEGGVAEPLIYPKEGDGTMQPHFPADARALVYTRLVGSEGRRLDIAVLSLDTGEQRTLVENGHSPRVASSGHLLFARDGAVWAVAIDPERLEVRGPTVRVLEDVLVTTHLPSNVPSAQFHVADDGTLVYRPKETAILARPPRNLVWVDRQGLETPLAAVPSYYASPRIAPDGRRIAVTVNADGQDDIWIYSVDRGTSLRLTTDPASEYFPIWSADSERVAFASTRNGGPPDLFWKSAGGTGAVEPLLADSTVIQIPTAWSSDGGEILYIQSAPGNLSSFDIWVLSLDAERTAKPLLHAEFSEDFAEFSPDGRWIAYFSNQSGRNEVYLRPYPNVNAGVTTVSTNGGSMPLWHPDGREIIYVQSLPEKPRERQLVAVPFDDGVLGQPETLIDLGSYWGFIAGGFVDIHPDGNRFLVVKEQSDDELPNDQIVVVLNWLEEVTRLVPTD